MLSSFRIWRVLWTFLSLALCTVASLTAAAERSEFPGIERLMTDEEFRASGLQKLTADERRVLDNWLLRYTAGEAKVLQRNNDVVKEVQAKEDFAIVSRITGDFDGWSGDTIFRLENGQIWEQRLNGRYRYRGPPNPEVRIDKNWAGFYRMTVLETGRKIGVSPR